MRDKNWKNEKCGTCHFAVPFKPPSHIVQANITKVFECRESRPQILLIPSSGPNGPSLQVQADYVKVSEHFPACGRYEKNSDVEEQKSTESQVDFTKMILPKPSTKNGES